MEPFDEQKTNMTPHEIGPGVAMPHWRKDTSNTSDSCPTVTLMTARADGQGRLLVQADQEAQRSDVEQHPARFRNHAGVFDFDIRRPDDLPKQLDQLLRRADHAIERGNFADADLPISRILELHPHASAAYQVLARRAERLENWKEAADAYERALELVQTGRDSLRRHPEPQVLIGALRASAAEAGGRQNRR